MHRCTQRLIIGGSNINRKVYYFGTYADEDDIRERLPVVFPAVTTKMRFIAECINGHLPMTVVSPGFSTRPGYSAQKIVKKHGFRTIYLASMGDGLDYLTFSKRFFACRQIKKYMHDNVRASDIVILYSQPWLNLTAINELRKMDVSFVLEVEECQNSFSTLIKFQ